MVELRSCISTNYPAASCIALKEQDIKSVGLCQELSLSYLFLTPKLVRFRRKRALLLPLRPVYMHRNDLNPPDCFGFTFSSEKELAVVSVHFDSKHT